MLGNLFDSIQARFARPFGMNAIVGDYPGLCECPEMDARGCIAEGRVVRWHEWASGSALRWPRLGDGRVMGWRYRGGRYSSFTVQRRELVEFCDYRIEKNWCCDIQDVQGFSASKADLTLFKSLDHMISVRWPELLTPVTEAKLRENLSHGEIRILQPNSIDAFAHYAWDGRAFLLNHGGSHHFAAARYLATQLEIPVPLTGVLHSYAINERAVLSLTADFAIFVIQHDPVAFNAFTDAMERCRATYLMHSLPRPYDEGYRAVFLPKAEPRSSKAAAAMRASGFFDLGAHLLSLPHQSV